MLYLCIILNFPYMELEKNLAINMLFMHTQKDTIFPQVHLHRDTFQNVAFLLKHAVIWTIL